LPNALRYVSGMTAPPRFRVGLRVPDVEAALQFYEGLGFVLAEIAQPIRSTEPTDGPTDGAGEAQAAWFGSSGERP
jgi:catechol 2,3-dioxygenase-like lactoylglutathione lyase family enzyme